MKIATITTTITATVTSIPKILLLLLLAAITGVPVTKAQQPLIYDSDHGPFIDDIFALGLLLNSADLIDMQLVLGTSEQPELSATCIAAQIKMSGMEGMVPVAMGEELPPYEDRGSVCGYVWSVLVV